MNRKLAQIELDDDQRQLITELFFEKIVPKLKKLQARNGTLSCKFAGHEFENWLLFFKETGNGFEITEFEYDPDARDLDLDF